MREVDFCEAKRRRERKRKTTPQSAVADSSPDKGSRRTYNPLYKLCLAVKAWQGWGEMLTAGAGAVAVKSVLAGRVKSRVAW